MSERAPHTEKVKSLEHTSNHEAKEREAKHLEKLIEKAEKAHDNKEHVPTLETKAKHEAVSGKERSLDTGKEKDGDSSLIIDKTVRKTAYKKTLRQVQRQLPKRQRAFSKFIHAPKIEAISEVGSKTVARPSGLLGGGFFALLGTSIVVWMSHFYGFRYNFFVYVALLIGGFALGIALEYTIKFVRKVAGK